jgi:hypothetical protein
MPLLKLESRKVLGKDVAVKTNYNLKSVNKGRVGGAVQSDRAKFFVFKISME